MMDPGLTNMAQLVFSLDREGDLDGGTVVAPEVHDIIDDQQLNFHSDVAFGQHGDPVELFGTDPVILGLLGDLDQAGVFTGHTPRRLYSPAVARNELRRNILGILRFRDVKIPLANGSYVLADVFRPAKVGPVPAILNCGYYGKAFDRGSICDESDLEKHERLEDEYFQGNREGLIYENHESVNTVDWVPHGYAVVRIESPGAGKTPGTIAPLGIEAAEAFRDAIEWAGEQSWSNGNVGLWGMSYHAMSQHSVASLHPPHLKAMIAIGTDIDLYEEFVYTGGLLNEEFFPFWYRFTMFPAVCGEPQAVDLVRIIKEHPFKDSDPETVFGARGRAHVSRRQHGLGAPLGGRCDHPRLALPPARQQ